MTPPQDTDQNAAPELNEGGRGHSGVPVALGMLLFGLLAFMALAWWLVPWEPVPGGMPQPVAESGFFSPSELAQNESYASEMRLLGWISLGVSLAVASLLGFTRLGRALMQRLPQRWWLASPIGVFVVLLAGRLATLPVSVIARTRQLEVGLTTQSWPDWLRDVAVTFGINWFASTLLVLVIVGCAKRWTAWWPAIAGTLLAGLVVVASFVYPVLVEPLFNDFTSLPDGELRTQVLALAQAEGVHIDDVLVADASRRTTTLNAYVSGFADTRRVVLYDTLVDDVPQSEALSVVAHELAHAKHDDVITGTLLGAAGSVYGVGLMALLLTGAAHRADQRAAQRASRQPGRRAQRTARRTPSGLADLTPAVLALVAWGAFLSSPIHNGISRQIETRADVVALEVTHNPQAMIRLQVALTLRSLADPNPPAWSQWWNGSHPTAVQRIALAQKFDQP